MFVLYSCMAMSNKESLGLFVLYSRMAMSNKESLRYVGIIFMYGDVQ